MDPPFPSSSFHDHYNDVGTGNREVTPNDGEILGVRAQWIGLDMLSTQVTIKETLYPSSNQEEDWVSTLIKACLKIL